jgi:hypothetical protein
MRADDRRGLALALVDRNGLGGNRNQLSGPSSHRRQGCHPQ